MNKGDRAEGEWTGGCREGRKIADPASWFLRPQPTAWIRLIRSANFVPYLSHTGLTASWNGFLSAIGMISMPAVFMPCLAPASVFFPHPRASVYVSPPTFLPPSPLSAHHS